MSNLQISTQEDLLSFLRNNLSQEKNLSIRGVAALCGVADKSLINGGSFHSQKLGETLIKQGFEVGSLIQNGFNTKATWLVIEYFAYESKAKAVGAKQIARTFGQLGIELTFTKLIEIPKMPSTFAQALRLAAEQAEELERQQQIIESQEQDLERQAEAIDELFDYSSIIRIAKYNNCSETLFSWRVLKSSSINLGLEIKKVPCPRFVEKSLYPHDAWRLAYPAYKVPETTTLIINPPQAA